MSIVVLWQRDRLSIICVEWMSIAANEIYARKARIDSINTRPHNMHGAQTIESGTYEFAFTTHFMRKEREREGHREGERKRKKNRKNEISTISFSASVFCQPIRKTCYFRIICTTSRVKLGQPCACIRMKNKRKLEANTTTHTRNMNINARDAVANVVIDDDDTMAKPNDKFLKLNNFFLFSFFFCFILRRSSTFRTGTTNTQSNRYRNAMIWLLVGRLEKSVWQMWNDSRRAY